MLLQLFHNVQDPYDPGTLPSSANLSWELVSETQSIKERARFVRLP